jgi:hypothetical protein
MKVVRRTCSGLPLLKISNGAVSLRCLLGSVVPERKRSRDQPAARHIALAAVAGH